MKLQYSRNNPVKEEHVKSEERRMQFIATLSREASRRVQLRTQIEERWLTDLRQYHGILEPNTDKTLQKRKKSRLNINMTRSKTNGLSARLGDLLFPTDERNWGIAPTPVPELRGDPKEQGDLIEDAADTVEDRGQKMKEAYDLGEVKEATQMAVEMTEAEQILEVASKGAEKQQRIIKAAKKASDNMQAEIDDQLVECDYQTLARSVIDDACQLGTGVLKGPVVGQKPQRKWRVKKSKGENGEQRNIWILDTTKYDNRPSSQFVDIWGFFPDPDYKDINKGTGVYERHLWSKKALRAFARRPDVDKDAVRDIIENGSYDAKPAYVAELHTLNDERSGTSMEETYTVWEYTGPIDGADLQMLGEAYGDEVALDEAGEVDPLDERMVKVWFCGNEVLSFSISPLDSQETIYSAFRLHDSEHGPFGYGVPYLCRNSARMVGAAGRKLMDNAGLAAEPIIELDRNIVEVVGDNPNIHGGMTLVRKANADPNKRGVHIHEIPMHQAELAAIIGLGQELMDVESGIPQIAQGEQGAQMTKTFQGMALLLNSANVIFRGYLKAWDDDITLPHIRRYYDWNMQFNEREDIKGDYQIKPRGSSVLLVKEMQAQNMLVIAEMSMKDPDFAAMIDREALYEYILRSHSVPAAEIMKTKTQQEKERQDARANPKPSPEQMAMQAEAQAKKAELELKREQIQADIQIAKMEADSRERVAMLTHETQAMRLAADQETTLEKIYSDLQNNREEREQKDRSLAVEVETATRTGEHAGGSI